MISFGFIGAPLSCVTPDDAPSPYLVPGVLAVLFRMLSCGIVLVLSRFQVMTKCNPGMMRGLLVIASSVVLGSFAMMFGGLVIVLRCLFVMLVNLVLGHSVLPEIS